MKVLFLLIFISNYCWAFQDKECVKDTDCISAKADTCGCSSGGKSRSIHRDKLEEWLRYITNDDMSCLAVISTHWSCVRSNNICKDSKCLLVERAALGSFQDYDRSKCQGIKYTDDRSRCFYAIAMRDKDYRLCDGIKGGWLVASSQECVAIIYTSLKKSPTKLSLGLCQKLNSEGRYKCLLELSLKKGNLALCDYLDKQQAQDCQSQVFRSLYMKEQKLTICEKQKESMSTNEIDSCFIFLANKKGRADICLQISHDNYPNFYKCVKDIARKLKKPQVCEVLEKWQGQIPNSLRHRANYSLSFCKSLKTSIRF